MNEETIKKIQYWYINELKDLIENVLKGDAEIIEGKKRYEIVDEILEKFGNEDSFKKFLLNFESLKDVSINKAVNCLIEHFKIPIDEARRIERRSALILIIYKYNLVKKLDFIRFISSFEQYKNEAGYLLKIEPMKDIDKTIVTSLIEFYKDWNNNNKDFIFAELIPTEENFFPVRITKEIGRRYQREFLFRAEKKPPHESLDPEEFKTEGLENFPVSYRNISIKKINEDLFELIFDFKLNREKHLVERILYFIFGLNIDLDQLEYTKSDIIKLVQNSTKNMFDQFKTESFSNVKEKFKEMQNQALKKINKLDESSDNKKVLKNIIRKTYILPPKIFDVVEKGIIKLDLDIDPEDFAKDPKGKRIIEDFYKLSSEIEEDKKVYIYLLNGKKIELHPKKVNLIFKNLVELEQKALKLIFGDKD